MSKEFFVHNRPDKGTRTTCAGVYVEEKGCLVVSGVALPRNAFSKRKARQIALIKTSVRPFFEIPVKSLKEAYMLFIRLGRAIVVALEEDVNKQLNNEKTYNSLFPRTYRMKETTDKIQPAYAGGIAEVSPKVTKVVKMENTSGEGKVLTDQVNPDLPPYMEPVLNGRHPHDVASHL